MYAGPTLGAGKGPRLPLRPKPQQQKTQTAVNTNIQSQLSSAFGQQPLPPQASTPSARDSLGAQNRTPFDQENEPGQWHNTLTSSTHTPAYVPRVEAGTEGAASAAASQPESIPFGQHSWQYQHHDHFCQSAAAATASEASPAPAASASAAAAARPEREVHDEVHSRLMDAEEHAGGMQQSVFSQQHVALDALEQGDQSTCPFSRHGSPAHLSKSFPQACMLS